MLYYPGPNPYIYSPVTCVILVVPTHDPVNPGDPLTCNVNVSIKVPPPAFVVVILKSQLGIADEKSLLVTLVVTPSLVRPP